MVKIYKKETPTQKELTIKNDSGFFMVIFPLSVLTLIFIPLAISYFINFTRLDIGSLIFSGVYFIYIIISVLYLRTRKMTLIKDKEGGKVVLIKRYYFKDEKKIFDNYKNLLIRGYKNKIINIWDISIEEDMKLTKLSTSSFFPCLSLVGTSIFEIWRYTEIDIKEISAELGIPFKEIK